MSYRFCFWYIILYHFIPFYIVKLVYFTFYYFMPLFSVVFIIFVVLFFFSILFLCLPFPCIAFCQHHTQPPWSPAQVMRAVKMQNRGTRTMWCDYHRLWHHNVCWAAPVICPHRAWVSSLPALSQSLSVLRGRISRAGGEILFPAGSIRFDRYLPAHLGMSSLFFTFLVTAAKLKLFVNAGLQKWFYQICSKDAKRFILMTWD